MTSLLVSGSVLAACTCIKSSCCLQSLVRVTLEDIGLGDTIALTAPKNLNVILQIIAV